MALPLIPIVIGLGVVWFLSKYGKKPSGGGVTPSDVQTAVYNAIAFEHDPAQLNAFADQLDAQGYHSQAAVLREHAREMTSSNPADQQSALLRKGIAALKAGGH